MICSSRRWLWRSQKCRNANVQFAGDQLYRFQRADISVAVAIPGGLITPVIKDCGSKRLTAIATEMQDLAVRAREESSPRMSTRRHGQPVQSRHVWHQTIRRGH